MELLHGMTVCVYVLHVRDSTIFQGLININEIIFGRQLEQYLEHSKSVPRLRNKYKCKSKKQAGPL